MIGIFPLALAFGLPAALLVDLRGSARPAGEMSATHRGVITSHHRQPVLAAKVVRAVVALSLSLALVAEVAHSQVEPLIAYESGDAVKTIRPDGSGRVVLLPPARRFAAAAPAWSSTGSLLAFLRIPRGERDERLHGTALRVRDVGSGFETVVGVRAVASSPSFSPDESWLAYAAEQEPEAGEASIRALGLRGQGAVSVTQPRERVRDVDPAWSPDGAQIAFTRVRYVRQLELGVWSVPAGGGAAVRLANRAFHPAWSPDGSQIAFVSVRDRNGETCFHDCFPNGEIYVMNADGSGKRRLTRTATAEGAPAWSPDGSQIAFESARPDPEGNSELYTMRADGSCVTRLTNTSVPNSGPAWRPGAHYAAPLVCDGAVPAVRAPVMETDLSAARRFRRPPLAWLGPSWRGVLLSAVDIGRFVTLVYDDCGRVTDRCGFDELQIQVSSTCHRDPLSYGGYMGPGEPDHLPHARRYRRIGPGLLTEYGFGDADLYIGPATVAIFGGAKPNRAAAVARRLRVFDSNRSALRPPRFSRRTLARVRSVERELRRYGRRELSKRWRVTPRQIRAAQRLRAALRPHEFSRPANCQP